MAILGTRRCPLAGEVDGLIRQMSEEVIQNQREAFVAQMRQRVDITYMKQVMLDGLVTGLSARELRAAAVFYGTPEGKAIRETEGDRRHHAPDSKGARSDGATGFLLSRRRKGNVDRASERAPFPQHTCAGAGSAERGLICSASRGEEAGTVRSGACSRRPVRRPCSIRRGSDS